MRSSFTYLATAGLALAGALAIPLMTSITHIHTVHDVATSVNRQLAGKDGKKAAAPAQAASAPQLEAYKP